MTGSLIKMTHFKSLDERFPSAQNRNNMGVSGFSRSIVILFALQFNDTGILDFMAEESYRT